MTKSKREQHSTVYIQGILLSNEIAKALSGILSCLVQWERIS